MTSTNSALAAEGFDLAPVPVSTFEASGTLLSLSRDVEKESEDFNGFKLWTKFVDWAYCHDLPLVVGAYALRRQYFQTSKKGKGLNWTTVLVFMPADAEVREQIDRVDGERNATLMNKTERIKKVTQEILDEERSVPAVVLDGLTRPVPEQWYADPKTESRVRERGELKVLEMPAAPDESKQKWKSGAVGGKRKRTATDPAGDLGFVLKRLESEKRGAVTEISEILQRMVKNLVKDDYEDNRSLLKEVGNSLRRAQKAAAAIAKLKATVSEDDSDEDDSDEESEK